MRKIMISINFSKNAINALRYIIDFFRYNESEFLIINAYQYKIYSDRLRVLKVNLVDVTKDESTACFNNLEVILNQILLKPNYTSVQASNILFNELQFINSKNVINSIYKYINKINIGMLITVNKGYTYLMDILMNSIVDNFNLSTNIPIVVLQNVRPDFAHY